MDTIFTQWFDNLNDALKGEDRQSQRFTEVILVFDEKTGQWCLMAV